LETRRRGRGGAAARRAAAPLPRPPRRPAGAAPRARGARPAADQGRTPPALPPTIPAAVAVLLVLLFNLGAYALNESARAWPLARAVLCCCCRRGGRARRGLLLASHRRRSAPHDAAPTGFWAWDLLEPRDPYRAADWTAACRAASPEDPSLGLAAFRALCVALFVFATTWELTKHPDGPRAYWTFFTNWTFVLFGACSTLGTALTLAAWRDARWRRYRSPTGPSDPGTPAVVAAVAARGLPVSRAGLGGAWLPKLAEATPWATAAGASADGGADPSLPLSTRAAVASADGGAPALGPAGPAGPWRWVDCGYVLLLQTVATASITLTVFYWALLYRGQALRVGARAPRCPWRESLCLQGVGRESGLVPHPIFVAGRLRAMRPPSSPAPSPLRSLPFPRPQTTPSSTARARRCCCWTLHCPACRWRHTTSRCAAGRQGRAAGSGGC
jgi:hypothetical protein